MGDNPSLVNPEPNVIVTNVNPKPKQSLKLPNKKFIIGFLTVLLIAILAVVAVFIWKNRTKIFKGGSVTAPQSKPKIPLTAKQDLEQTFKQTFTDPKDQDILKYLSFASKDRILETKFIDYSKAYQLVYKRYANSATIPIKKALIKLRAYLRPFPQFKESDFKLPK